MNEANERHKLDMLIKVCQWKKLMKVSAMYNFEKVLYPTYTGFPGAFDETLSEGSINSPCLILNKDKIHFSDAELIEVKKQLDIIISIIKR